MESCELDMSGLEQKQMTGSCKHANETAGSLKREVFVEWCATTRLSSKASTIWS
jgi:hypothetical protein